MKKLRLIGFACLTLAIGSCASKSATASTAQASPSASSTPAAAATDVETAVAVATKNPTATVLTPELAAGKMSYENNCAKCHKLFSPKDFSKAEWAPILVSMQKKAHLSDAEMAPITNYIYTQL